MIDIDITVGDALQILATVVTVVIAFMRLSGKMDTLSSLFKQHVDHDQQNFDLIRRDFDHLRKED